MTKQKIPGFVPRASCNILQAQEYMEQIAGVVGKYFNNVGNFISDVREPRDNTMYVYCKVENITPCDEMPCRAYDNIDMPNTYGFDVANSVYEWMHLNDPQNGPDGKNTIWRVTPERHLPKLCRKAIKITMDGFVIGEFCPKRKILVTTDWADTSAHTPFVADVMTKLSGLGLIETKKGRKKEIPKITYGMDPELEVMVNNSVVSAQGLPVLEDNRIGKDGDGNGGHQRELRPKPGATIDEALLHFEELLRVPTGEKWSLRGEKYPLGGHIHFGGVGESIEFAKALDYFLDPLDALQSPARKSSGYGKKTDIRKQPHGIEYRTLPSAWLSTRKLAKLTMTIAEAVAKKHYSGEDIETTGDLVEDIVSLGLDRRIALDFISEVDKLKNGGIPTDVRKSWGVKQEVNPIIEFRDHWDSKVKSLVKDVLSKHMKEEGISDTIILYGLSEERGNVFSANVNFSPEGYGIIPVLREGFGIPYSVRTNVTNVKEVMDYMKKLVSH